MKITNEKESEAPSMAETPSFLSRLFSVKLFKKFRFSRKKKDANRDAPLPEGPRVRARGEGAPEKPLHLSERQRPIAPEEDPYLLKFTAEHPLQQLWNLRRDQAGWLPSVEVTFANIGEEKLLTPKEARRELPGLRALLTAEATRRLKEAAPPPPRLPGPGGEPPEPPQIDLNARALVYTASDKLTAWTLLLPPVGKGEELNQADLLNAVRAAGVTYGVDENQLAVIPTLEGRYFHLFPIARGKAAIPGKDGEIVDLFPREATKKFQVDEYNRVDFTAANTSRNVEEKQVICNIVPPTPGVPGRTVADQEITARDGVSVPPPMGRNTALSEDGSALIAARAGGLEFTGQAFHVNPLMEIDGNVDYSTGSVNFLGDVHVHGDVCSGFTVRAMGNIKVDGVVESSTIEAGGDLVLTKGVQGNNQAVIRAHRDIYAKFLENCSVHAKENLHSECIIGCEVYSDGAVYVQSGRGAIMGGRVRATREVAANAIGTKTELRTSIYIGGLPIEDFETAQLTQEITDLEQQLKETERQPSSPTKAGRMAKLRMRISVNQLKLSQYKKSLDALDSDSGRRPAGRITFSVAYPGARFHIDEALMKVAQETRHSIATLFEGEVRLLS